MQVLDWLNDRMHERFDSELDLLRHYRNRDKPRNFFDKAHKKDIVETISKQLPEALQSTLYAAEQTRNYCFKLAGNPKETPFLQMSRPIDWNQSPNGDREGKKTLNRMFYTIDLAKAYWYTDDQQYVHTFIEIWEDWCRNNPAPHDGRNRLHTFEPWNVLDTALRLKTWIEVHYMIMDADCWTPDINARFLKSIHEHIDHLTHIINVDDHNHTLMEMDSLLYGGIMFPEFLKSKQWIETATSTLERCIRKQVYDDGIHVEAVTAYHNHAVFMLAMPYILAQKNGVQMSEKYESLLKKMFEFSKYSHRPNGECSPIGDSELLGDFSRREDIATVGYYLFGMKDMANFVELTERMVWLIGANPVQPTANLTMDEPSKSFPTGGYYCLQNEWGENAIYALMRCGPFVHGHPHADLLSFDLFAFGRSLLTDVGKYTYNECTDRRYLKGTAAHNTVVVNGHDQAEYEARMSFKTIPEYNLNHWTVKDDYVLVDAEHYGFHRLWTPITHRRQMIMIDQRFYLVIDRIEGEGNHDIEQFWHFSDHLVHMAADQRVSTHDKKGSNLLLIPLVTSGVKAELFEGWISEQYGIKKRAKKVRYWKKGDLPIVLGTVLYPQLPSRHDDIQIQSTHFDDHKALISLKINDQQHYNVTVTTTGQVEINRNKG